MRPKQVTWIKDPLKEIFKKKYECPSADYICKMYSIDYYDPKSDTFNPGINNSCRDNVIK